jgi:hypothetical protein
MPVPGLALLAGGYVSKDLVLKMLGPTADYIGADVADASAELEQGDFDAAETLLAAVRKSP